MADLTFEQLSIHAAADALAGGLSSVELVETLNARYDEVHGELNSFISYDKESALLAAAEADARRKDGKSLGAYDGIPIAIKDNISVNGQANTCGSRILQGYTSTYDATVVEKLKEAGFIPLGRTNMDEFAMGSSTENSAYEVAPNPHDTNRVPGGSSGGSAAAVASGQAIVALGSDTGGSIRQPAAFCGNVGLKPTYGRVSRYGLTAFASSLDQIGPISSNVKDAAIILETISGLDKMDSTSLPNDCTGIVDGLEADSLKGMKVGFPKEFLEIEGIDADVVSAVESKRDQLKAAGAEIIDISFPNLEAGVAVYYVIATAEASSNLSRFEGIRYGARQEGKDLIDIYYKTRSAGFGNEVKRRIILGTYVLGSYSDKCYLTAQKVRTLIRQDFEAAFKQCDIILTPVSPTTAFKIGEIEDPLQMYLADIFTIPVNLTGNCAVSIPAGKDSKGLPVNVQLIGDYLQEATLLKTAFWLEKEG